MTNDSKQLLIDTTLELLALHGPEQISMRQLSKETGLQQSVIYYHFTDKEALIDAAFMQAQAGIRQALMSLPPLTDAHQMLKQRIEYHLDNGHLIVPMLRYFMAYKLEKPNEPGGFIPPQAYMHIEQPIRLGVEQGIYFSKDTLADAKVVVHALNGFVLEHFPNQLQPTRKKQLTTTILKFVERALGNKEVIM